jgi:hypothetical protein
MEFAKPGYKVAKGISLLMGIVVISLLWLMESTREANEIEIAAILKKSEPIPFILDEWLNRSAKESMLEGMAVVVRPSESYKQTKGP